MMYIKHEYTFLQGFNPESCHCCINLKSFFSIKLFTNELFRKNINCQDSINTDKKK